MNAPGHLHSLRILLLQFPIVAIIGPRQVGKTTLARQLIATRGGATTVFDLESSEDLARRDEPLVHLSPLKGLHEIRIEPDAGRSARRRPDCKRPTIGV